MATQAAVESPESGERDARNTGGEAGARSVARGASPSASSPAAGTVVRSFSEPTSRVAGWWAVPAAASRSAVALVGVPPLDGSAIDPGLASAASAPTGSAGRCSSAGGATMAAAEGAPSHAAAWRFRLPDGIADETSAVDPGPGSAGDPPAGAPSGGDGLASVPAASADPLIAPGWPLWLARAMSLGTLTGGTPAAGAAGPGGAGAAPSTLGSSAPAAGSGSLFAAGAVVPESSCAATGGALRSSSNGWPRPARGLLTGSEGAAWGRPAVTPTCGGPAGSLPRGAPSSLVSRETPGHPRPSLRQADSLTRIGHPRRLALPVMPPSRAPVGRPGSPWLTRVSPTVRS